VSIKTGWQEFSQVITSACEDLDINELTVLKDNLICALFRKNTIFIFGNGGSGTLASHFAHDLNKGVIDPLHEVSFRAISLSNNISEILARGNDDGFETIFGGQIKNLAIKDDIAIGISVSGESKNILDAMYIAKEMGLITVGLTGIGENSLSKLVDFPVHISSNSCAVVEPIHDLILHWLISSISLDLVYLRRIEK